MRVIEAVEDVAGRIELGGKDVSAGQLAERLGFTPARQRTPSAICPVASVAGCS